MSEPLADRTSEAAVIDVGSNSVRLVAYQLNGRAFTPFLNEKVMAGLGRDLNATGRLSPDGVTQALNAMRRFRDLVDGLAVSNVTAVATAAVREAGDGEAFAQRVLEETGFELRVISGLEEARLSGLGVLSGNPKARGIVGDLGGSSLELVEVADGVPGRGETWPLGPLSLIGAEPFESDRVSGIIDQFLSRSRVLAEASRRGRLYAVGGAWRALGRIDIALRRHPLGVLHHHEMSRSDVLRTSEFVRKQSRKSLERFEEAAAKRAEALPYAAMVLERVLGWGDVESVILSSQGLREGVLFDQMSEAERRIDPLLASAEAFGANSRRAGAFAAALERFCAPLAGAHPLGFGAERDLELVRAAARLAECGATLHPDQRREIMFDMVLRAPLVGLSHAERAFLAAVAHHRYTRGAPDGQPAYDRLLSEEQRAGAAGLGACFRLAVELSGRAAPVLDLFALAFPHAIVELRARRDRSYLITETAIRRQDALAAALGASARIAFSD